MSEQRWAKVYGADYDVDRVAAYLPEAWRVTGFGYDTDKRRHVRIAGYDVAGWTFEDYVKPRLASGLMFAEEE